MSKAIIKTEKGDMTVQFYDVDAPNTVANFLKLAKQGYYDGVTFHRVINDFVIQGGDPTGTGTGGPGFNIPDENLPQPTENNYPAGTVAMANAGPGTSGSQFFLVYQDTTLENAAYTIWGSITSGLDILQTIASAGVVDGGADGAPATGVTIESTKVTIS